jgi:prevent-host-death family protein
MKRIWKLKEAKNKFSEVVKEALSQGPQIVTRRGIETVIILSYSEYCKLTMSQKKLSEFFRESPLVDTDIDICRDTSDVRPDIPL